MAFSKGKNSITLEELLSRVSEIDILHYYLGITEIPTIINSPLREDKRPSFGLFSIDGKRIFYHDLATNARGGTFDLLRNLWGIGYKEVLSRISNDMEHHRNDSSLRVIGESPVSVNDLKSSNTELKCKTREWRDHDIAYWKSYGISLEWLKYADIYPISHKIVIKNGQKFIFNADKYAYAYVERKEKRVTLKIYQPYNKLGYKWSNKHDTSVISLWTKIPEYGENICICSSLKDALCLWANTGIPAVATQGEAYFISKTAINELKRRFDNIYILFDNDEAGIMDGQKLSEYTGFKNLVLPKINEAKDISDLYLSLHDNIEIFKNIIKDLFEQV